MDHEQKADLESKMTFLEIAQNKVSGMTDNIDSQIDILIGIGSVLMVYSASKISSEDGLFFGILAIFAAAATISGLIAIHPFRFMRKRNGDQCITYNKLVTSFPCPGDYAEEVRKVTDKADSLMDQVSIGIYNTYKYYYQPKRRMYTLTRNILIVGVLLSFLILLVQLITR